MSKIFPFTSRGGSLEKKFFFQSEHVSSQIWCQKFFPLPVGGGGGPLTKNFFFFQSEHVSSQIWCQKFFPLPVGGVPQQKFLFSSLNMYQAKSGVKNFSLYQWGGGDPLTKIFFSSLNMYQAKSGVKNFSVYQGGGGSLNKIFFPQSEHVSSQIWCQKFFPLPVGESLDKIFFFQSEHVSSQIWCQKFFPLPVGGGGVPSTKNFFSSLNMYQAKSGVKNFSLYR